MYNCALIALILQFILAANSAGGVARSLAAGSVPAGLCVMCSLLMRGFADV